VENEGKKIEIERKIKNKNIIKWKKCGYVENEEKDKKKMEIKIIDRNIIV